VTDSIITGNIVTADTATSTLNLNSGSSWYMYESSNITTLNAGSYDIDMRSISSGYNTLTLNNYTGNGNTIYMNTYLGNESSPTDKIVIDGGNVSSNTILQFTNNGGPGMPTNGNGIQVVEAINGAIIGSGSFSLAGGELHAGAWVYQLAQGTRSDASEQSLYLRNKGLLSNAARGTANEPPSVIGAMKSGMNALMKRMGELREENPEHHNGLWIRGHGKNLHIDDKTHAKMNVYGTEAGYDWKFHFDESKLFVGAAIGFTYIDEIRNHYGNGARDGEGISRSPSVGAYATWMHESGLFVDAIVRNFWSNFKLTSYNPDGTSMRYKPDRYITAYSVEIGKQFRACIDDSSMWIWEPRVEFMYAYSNAKSFKSNLGDNIRYGDTNSYTGKISLMAGYKKAFENGIIAEPYVQVGGIQEFHGKTNVTFDDAHYRSDLKGASLEVGGGLNMKFNDSWAMYGQMMYEKGSVIQSLSGNLGFRYSW
ncbi:MAG: autotransporter outer membrane beta-barrel domain-containing protein, partial [Lactobacillus sp.]|nr:autotransporter outer membrane beta-barrel domain-containing protein [Lactobacillus sp.]